ncbi:hypothetical protein ACN6QZ_13565, partial [Acinetobacter baumannii]
MLIFTLFLVHQFEAKDIPVLNSAQIKSALNKKTKLSVWPSFLMYIVSVSYTHLTLPTTNL